MTDDNTEQEHSERNHATLRFFVGMVMAAIIISRIAACTEANQKIYYEYKSKMLDQTSPKPTPPAIKSTSPEPELEHWTGI